jgi:hypothetical protein
MPYLGKEWDVEFTAFDEQGPVFSACWRQIPESRYNSDAFEVLLSNIMLYFLHIADGVIQINARDPDDPVWIRSGELCNVGVGHDGPTRSIPGGETDLLYAGFVHKLDQLIWLPTF